MRQTELDKDITCIFEDGFSYWQSSFKSIFIIPYGQESRDPRIGILFVNYFPTFDADNNTKNPESLHFVATAEVIKDFESTPGIDLERQIESYISSLENSDVGPISIVTCKSLRKTDLIEAFTEVFQDFCKPFAEKFHNCAGWSFYRLARLYVYNDPNKPSTLYRPELNRVINLESSVIRNLPLNL